MIFGDLEVDLIIFTIVWLGVVCGFGFYYKYWVKEHKVLYSLLIIAFIFIVGDFYPTWWERGAVFYSVPYNLSIGYIGAFIFYWITIVLKEVKQEIYYSFKILRFFSNYFNIVAFIFYKDRYKKYMEGSFCTNKFTLVLPLDSFLKHIKEVSPLLEIEIIEFKKRINTSRNQAIKSIKATALSLETATNLEHIEFLKECKKNYLESYNSKNYLKSDYLFKRYLEFCNEIKEFKGIFDVYGILGDFETLNHMDTVLNHFKKYSCQTSKGYELLLENYKFIIGRLEKILLNKIKILKIHKMAVPDIEIEFLIFNFGHISEEFKKQIILDFSSNLSDIIIEYFENSDIKTVNVKNIQEKFILGEDGKKYYLRDLYQALKESKLRLLFKVPKEQENEG